MVDLKYDRLPFIKREIQPRTYTLCKNGDVAFADASEDTNDIAKAVELKNCDNKAIVCGLHTIHGRDKSNSTIVGYKGYAFASFAFHRQIRRLAQGTKIYSINIRNFSESYIGIPSKQEQEQISMLLLAIDRRIVTQSLIIEKLQSLIKGLNDFLYNSLQSNDICKIGDYCQFYSGGTPPSANPNYYGGTIPFIRSGEIKKNFTELLITEDGLNNSAAKLIHKGDILIAMYGATSGEISIAQIDGAINQAILCVKTTLNPYFFMAIWERMKNSILTKYLQGGQGNLSANIIKNISVPIPSNIIQNTISNIYRQLEKRLSMESELLSLLQKQKRYFLRQMFI